MDTQSAAWYDVIGKFREQAAKFTAAYNALLATENSAKKSPALYAEYSTLRKKADDVKAKVQKVTGAVDQAAAWLKSAFGLGALPALVPVAVVVSAVAAMSYIVADISKFVMRVRQFETVSAQVGPEKAAAIVAQSNPGGGVFDSFGASVKSVALLVAVIAGVYYLPKLVKK